MKLKKYSLILSLLALIFVMPLAYASTFEEYIEDTSLSFTDSLDTIGPLTESIYDVLGYNYNINGLYFSDSISISRLPLSRSFLDSGLNFKDSHEQYCYGCTIVPVVPGPGSPESVEKFISDESLGVNDPGFSLIWTHTLVPLAFLVGTLAVGVQLGIKTKILVGLAFFIIIGLSWIGILPPWFIFVGIIMVAGVLAYIVSKFVGGGED